MIVLGITNTLQIEKTAGFRSSFSISELKLKHLFFNQIRVYISEIKTSLIYVKKKQVS